MDAHAIAITASHTRGLRIITIFKTFNPAMRFDTWPYIVTRRALPCWIHVYRIVTCISSSRNIAALEMEYGSARLRYADPLRRPLGLGHQPRARGYMRAEGKWFPAADSLG